VKRYLEEKSDGGTFIIKNITCNKIWIKIIITWIEQIFVYNIGTIRIKIKVQFDVS